jgi:hypothetical protein
MRSRSVIPRAKGDADSRTKHRAAGSVIGITQQLIRLAKLADLANRFANNRSGQTRIWLDEAAARDHPSRPG